jgi:L-amino acid N-acyltransferase YncA
MSSVPIRPATPADIAAITRIYDYAVRHGTASFEIEPPDEAEIAARQSALLAGGYPFLVAQEERDEGSEVLGYAYAGPYRTRPAYRHTV